MSVYSDSAVLYADNGLSVIPCAAQTKFPGTYSSAHGWAAMPNWQRYGLERRPTGFETQIWDKWPDAGICLALGRQSGHNGLHLIAIDIDTDNPEEVAAIKSVLPGSPCAKRGAKGETQFYLASEKVKSRPYNDANRRRILDLLCEGRQTVMPPTLHPDLGQPYIWITPDALDSFAVADLPILPDDIADKLGEALKPFGYEETAPLAAGEGNASLDGINIHRELNDAALANLAAWIPSLQLYKCRQVGGNYKAVAHWRGSSTGRSIEQRQTNLIISPQGIRDKGAEKGYTPLDLVMAACDTDLDTAFRWLQDRVAPQPEIKLTARGGNLAALNFKPDLLEKQLHISDNDEPFDPETGEILPSASPQGNKAIASPKEDIGPIIPPDLCTPPGLIGRIVSWMNECSPVPSPQLNLSTVITFLGAIYGRRFESPTRARTNFYTIGLAKSGFGKSYPLECIDGLEAATGLDKFFGPSELKSDSALRNLLSTKNPVFMAIDEVGEAFGKMLDRNAQSHQQGLRRLLLDFFSSAKSVYRGSEGASEKAVRIENPHLCLAGMSTPSQWWKAFNSANAENGLLPRILVFDAGDKAPAKVKPTCEPDDVPDDIRRALHAALDARPVGNIAAADPTRKVKPIRAEWAEGAEEEFEALREWAEGMQDSPDTLIELCYSRFAEHAIKLALLYAVSINPQSPEITIAGLTWGRQIVECTTRALIEGATDRVADSEHDADYKRVKMLVRTAGNSGISLSALKKKIGGSIRKRELEDILATLKDAREIEDWFGSTSGGGPKACRLRIVEA